MPIFRLFRSLTPRKIGGFALPVVLILLAFATLLIVGLLSTVTTERVTARANAGGSGAHEMADAVVQIVIGQIKQATSGGGTTTWASQPGMIRTYDNKGAPVTNYKLYSSGAMTVDGTLTVSATAAAGSNNVNDYDPDWSANSALWTDLNAPVSDSEGKANYPIIDGTDLASPATNGGLTYPNVTTTGGQSVPNIQGFSVNNAPVATQGAVINPIPMPVQWMYRLRDGTLVTATSTGSGNTVSVAGASATNPIVGRLAFWTDDETSKININTACGDEWSPAKITTAPPNSQGGTGISYTPPGSYWDVPRAFSAFDYDSLTYVQPVQHEYQRYPGHPASVYLSAVFPSLTRDQLFSLVPRISGGKLDNPQGPLGSEGGTLAPTVVAVNPVNPDTDRLYASVDELLFAPTKTSTDRTLNDSTASILDKSTVERSKFFLTANSRAPEVNLFDQPRVAMWPIDSDVIKQEANHTLSPSGTAYDALIAFCSHLGPLGQGSDYCFQRQSPSDGSVIPNYLSPTQDYDLLAADGTPRNHVLYSYLQGLMSANIPGFGGSLASKFGSDSDQILTEIFDYIRCTNPSDDNIAYATTKTVVVPPWNYTESDENNDQYCYTPNDHHAGSILAGDYEPGPPILTPNPYHAFIAPAQITTSGGITQGFGRAFTISEAGLSFICCGDGGSSDQINPNTKVKYTAGDGGVSYTTADVPATKTTPEIPPYTYYSNFPPLGPVTQSSTLGYPPTGTPPKKETDAAANAFFSAASGYGLQVDASGNLTGPGYNPANWNYNLPTYNWAADTAGTQWTGLQPGQRRVKAIFLFQPYTVSPGYSTMHLDAGFEVSGLNSLALNGVYSGSGTKATIPLGFPSDNTAIMSSITQRIPVLGVNFPFWQNYYMAPPRALPEAATTGSPPVGDTVSPWIYGQNSSNQTYFNPTRIYPFISGPVTVTGNTMQLSGGSGVTMKIWHLSKYDDGTNLTTPTGNPAFYSVTSTYNPQPICPGGVPTSGAGANSSTLVQTINLDLSQLTTAAWQVPALMTSTGNGMSNISLWNVSNDPNVPNVAVEWDFSWAGIYENGNAPGFSPISTTPPTLPGRFWDLSGQGGHYQDAVFVANSTTNQGDVVETLVPGYPTDATGVAGDYRMLAAQNVVPKTVFVPHRLLTTGAPANAPGFFHSMASMWSAGQYMTAWSNVDTGWGASSQALPWCTFGALITSIPKVSGTDGLLPVQTGDFDNGTGSDMDGPYINKPDTGDNYNPGANTYPYFGLLADVSVPGYFSPNRQIPSPGMFGSLPTGVLRGKPWQTLLFRPQPTHPDGVAVPDAGTTGSGSPYGGIAADHLIMDLFWMPVVEPYAISEPFSTAGKINMNYQIAPFTYITRETAIDALFKSQEMVAIPKTVLTPPPNSAAWKQPYDYTISQPSANADYHFQLNLDDTTGTLRQFQEKFNAGDLFRSPSQICDIYLTPGTNALGTSAPLSWANNAAAVSFWAQNWFTGDNTKERPYANLYGCLTTKSNTFTVHYRVQALQKVPGTPAGQWVDGKDVVNSDYRGSSLIERYVDPSNADLPDFAANPASTDPKMTLDYYYKFRVLSSRRFAP